MAGSAFGVTARVVRWESMHREIAPIDPRSLPHSTTPGPPHFAVEELVPESVIHLVLRTFLYELLNFVLTGRAFVGSDQFVYFDGADPKRCVAPDVYVVPGSSAGSEVTSWKTWERGTPALCIEIDNSAVVERRWPEKLAHYRSMGVRELVQFTPEADAGARLRVWDRVDDDLVERVFDGDTTPCATLGRFWVVRAIERADAALRLAEDAEGRVLVLTAREHAEQGRVNAEQGRENAERERAKAAARVAELEAELLRRSGG